MKDPLPSDIFSTGQVLNNTYEIKGILGRGGTGEVYLAVNQISNRLSAIKALNAQFSGNNDYVELMKREEQMRDIMHDAVVRYSECSRTDDSHVILVMDYVEGVALSDVMYDRKLSEHDLMVIAHRVLSGLEATHAKGIVHRDLSPDNIILRDAKPERATIIDFGIAKDTAAGARTIVGTSFAGKYQYAAPEQLDGRAEFSSDLYALGASLLAVARSEVPDVGANPGEVVRYKQEPLDVSGLGKPLAQMISMLSAPDLKDRPATARAARDQLDIWLKPDSPAGKTRRPSKKQDKAGKSGGTTKFAIAAAVLVALGGGVFFSGALEGWMTPALPRVTPFTLNASQSVEGAQLAGHAPDQEGAALISTAFEGTTNTPVAQDALTLATGAPDPVWPADIADLLARMAPLDTWSFDVSDDDVQLTGIAPDVGIRNTVQAALGSWAARTGMNVQYNVFAGPVILAANALQDPLAQTATCGPLDVIGDTEGTFALSDPVTITGDIARTQDMDTIKERITPLIGERDLRVDTTVLNDDLCAIRAILPAAQARAVSIWLGRGATGEVALTGVYTTGQNPVVDIQMPATITGASLWVLIVDNTGKVYNILPNVNDAAHGVDDLGTVENGLRRIRVLWSKAELAEDPSRIAVEVDAQNYGKSEIVAILSRTPLFDVRRPRDESVTSLAKALSETLAGREDDLIGVASRIIDARP